MIGAFWSCAGMAKRRLRSAQWNGGDRTTRRMIESRHRTSGASWSISKAQSVIAPRSHLLQVVINACTLGSRGTYQNFMNFAPHTTTPPKPPIAPRSYILTLTEYCTTAQSTAHTPPPLQQFYAARVSQQIRKHLYTTNCLRKPPNYLPAWTAPRR